MLYTKLINTEKRPVSLQLFNMWIEDEIFQQQWTQLSLNLVLLIMFLGGWSLKALTTQKFHLYTKITKSNSIFLRTSHPHFLYNIQSSSLTPLSGQNLLHTNISYHLINSLCRNQPVGLNDLITDKAPRTKKSSVRVHPLSYQVVDLKSIHSDAFDEVEQRNWCVLYLQELDSALIQPVWKWDLWGHVDQGHILTLGG